MLRRDPDGHIGLFGGLLSVSVPVPVTVGIAGIFVLNDSVILRDGFPDRVRSLLEFQSLDGQIAGVDQLLLLAGIRTLPILFPAFCGAFLFRAGGFVRSIGLFRSHIVIFFRRLVVSRLRIIIIGTVSGTSIFIRFLIPVISRTVRLPAAAASKEQGCCQHGGGCRHQNSSFHHNHSSHQPDSRDLRNVPPRNAGCPCGRPPYR